MAGKLILPRYIAAGRWVYDAAYTDDMLVPLSGMRLSQVRTLYPSPKASLEAAQSLNRNMPTREAARAAFMHAQSIGLAPGGEVYSTAVESHVRYNEDTAKALIASLDIDMTDI